MKNEVSISFRYTEQDCVAAVRQYHDSFHRRLSGVFGALLVALGLFTRFVAGDFVIGWILVGSGALAILRFYLFYHAGPRRWHRRRPRDVEHTARFSDEGVVYRAEGIDSAVKWSFYRSARETEGFYFLLYGDGEYSVVPKRAFATAAGEQTFRELLREHLAAELEPAGGARAARAEEEYAPPTSGPPDWR
jgi:hypothetical protein